MADDLTNEEKRLKEAVKALAKKHYDLAAMEELFTLEKEELAEAADNPDDFNDSFFMNISRFIFRELNLTMATLGMHDKDAEAKVRFNQSYVNNCNAITTELLTVSARRDVVAINRLSLILHDYLSPYADKITGTE